MHWLMTLFTALLFFLVALIPIPPSVGGKYTRIAILALIFAILYHFTHRIVWHTLYTENFTHNGMNKHNDKNPMMPKPSIHPTMTHTKPTGHPMMMHNSSLNKMKY